MARVATYLNFKRETEEAFQFYNKVFETDFNGPIMRLSDVPASEGMPPFAPTDKNLVMHCEISILKGAHILRGSDSPESMGFDLKVGNNISINIELDTRQETDELFKKLSEGGTVPMPLADAFWGDYFGMCTDKFGINWMLIGPGKK